jgi:hypothetical protein
MHNTIEKKNYSGIIFLTIIPRYKCDWRTYSLLFYTCLIIPSYPNSKASVSIILRAEGLAIYK